MNACQSACSVRAACVRDCVKKNDIRSKLALGECPITNGLGRGEGGKGPKGLFARFATKHIVIDLSTKQTAIVIKTVC